MSGTTFPPILEVIRSHGPFVFTGPIFLLIAAAIWVFILRQVFCAVRARLRLHERGTDAWNKVRLFALISVIPLLIGVGHLYGTCTALDNALRWRIEPADVAEVEVVRRPVLGKPTVGPPVYLRNRAVLQDGFRRLAGARYYVNHGEHYQDGYQLRIREVGAAEFSERYLSVYRRSDRTRDLPVVVLERGPGAEYTADHVAGEFLSPAFLKWVVEVIDPHFAGRPK